MEMPENIESGSNKIRDNEFGKFAENIAAEYYVIHGYAIRERNCRIGRNEIDIIAQLDNTMVFVEVKARSGRDGSALESVTHDKMKRMAKAADSYLKNQKGIYEYRYDIFTLTGDFESYETEVFMDAFVSPLL